ncbi:MAG TPA: trypsin-like serine protease, partial [Coleofasciculaceae cyanobacterium]
GVMTTGALGEVRPNGDLRSRVRLEPGNSGGPLLNSYGEMIGINKAVLETETGQNTGISFATNVAVVYNFIEQYRPSQVVPSPRTETTLAQTVQPPQLPTPLPITSQPVRMPQWANSPPTVQSGGNLSELAIEPYATIPETMLPPTIGGLALEPYAVTVSPRP